MIPPNDVVADLPAPLDDEPPSVRQDIADELADHLACAYRRELLKTADERTAQQQVLDRFGNPQRIAYQLWFQALWGRIMLNRFGRIVQGLKIVGGLLVLFFVFRMAEQQTALHNQLVFLTASNNSMQSQAMGTRSLLEQLLARFPAPPQPEGSGMSSGGMAGDMSSMMMGAGGGSGMMGTADPSAMSGMSPMGMSGASGAATAPQRGLKLRITVEGKPAVGCTVSVVKESGESLTPYIHPAPMESEGGMGSSMGMMAPGMPGESMSGSPNNGRVTQLQPAINGEIYFAMMHHNGVPQILEPGRYTVQVTFPDGRNGTHRFAVPPEHKVAIYSEEIECPPTDEMTYVTFHVPLLDQKYIDAGMQTQIELIRKPLRIGKTDWMPTGTVRNWTIRFDPATGAPIGYRADESWRRSNGERVQKQPVYLADLPPEERFLVIPAGKYQVVMGWSHSDTSLGQPSVNYGGKLPAAGAAVEGVLSLATDTRDVLLNFPEGAFEKLDRALNFDKFKAQESIAPADAATAPR